MTKGPSYALGFVDHLPPGDVDDGPAGYGQSLITLPILLEGPDRAVHTAAVGFDDKSSVTPHEVGHHRDALDHEVAVHLCRPEAGTFKQTQEPLLKLAAGSLFLRIVSLDSKSKTSNPSSAFAPLQQRDHADQIEDTFDFGLIDRIAERPGWLTGGDIEQGPSEAGARNPIDHNPIGAGQRPIAVSGNPVGATSPPIWRDDVHAISRVVEDAVEIRGGAMGQNRSGTAR